MSGQCPYLAQSLHACICCSSACTSMYISCARVRILGGPIDVLGNLLKAKTKMLTSMSMDVIALTVWMATRGSWLVHIDWKRFLSMLNVLVIVFTCHYKHHIFVLKNQLYNWVLVRRLMKSNCFRMTSWIYSSSICRQAWIRILHVDKY